MKRKKDSVMQSIIWSNRAIDEFEKILRYWIKRNGTIDYSLKIETEIDRALILISENSFLGEE